jgi:SAM-dependent methyltransferase
MQGYPLGQSKHRLVFKESALAHKDCDGGVGTEIGAAAHNPFGLAGSINVSDERGFEFYRVAQLMMCGAYAEVDMFADAASLHFGDGMLDYVISSHMIEHHPNPLLCFIEWARVVRDGGIIFMIFPKRDADPRDQERPISTLEEIVGATADPGDETQHCYVYTLQLMKDVVEWFNAHVADGYRLEVVDEQETDDKVGNGHTLVLRKVRLTTVDELLGLLIRDLAALVVPPRQVVCHVQDDLGRERLLRQVAIHDVLAVEHHRCAVVHQRGSFQVVVVTEMDVALIFLNAGVPFSILKHHPFEAGSVIPEHPPVHQIFLHRQHAQVVTRILEAVVIDVINNMSRGWLHDFAVQAQYHLLATDAKAADGVALVRESPAVVVCPGEVLVIHQGVQGTSGAVVEGNCLHSSGLSRLNATAVARKTNGVNLLSRC